MLPRAILTLADQGRFGDAIVLLEKSGDTEVGGIVLLAFLSGIVGDFERAHNYADKALARHLTQLQRVYCLETKARTSATEDARRLLRNAHDLIAVTGNTVEHARFAVRYGRAVLNLDGIDAAVAELPRVRQTVLNAGDVPAVIDLHLLTAETEARR